MASLYPLIFKPIYKQTIWGGSRIAEVFNRGLSPNPPPLNTGESWDLSVMKKDMSVVANSQYEGMPFNELVELDRGAFLGTALSGLETFPLLIKLIDANDNLSVQVHPNDEYARILANYPYGKTEMWYIIDAIPDASLIIGLKNGVTKNDFKAAIENNTVEECLCRLPVKKGDVVNIPSGLVHAITSGILLAEIQQNCDITYRIFDYNRLGADGKPRELHIAESLEVIDFDSGQKNCVTGISVTHGDAVLTYYIENKYLAVIKYQVNGSIIEQSDPERFFVFTCIEGGITIECGNGQTAVAAGTTVLIPAGLGEYTISGKAALLKSYVPDTNNGYKGFRTVLTRLGYSINEIEKLTDC